MSRIGTLIQQLSTKAAEVSAPSPSLEQRLLVVKLLASKQFDPSGVAAVIDGKEVTYGDLKSCRIDNAVRPDGSVGAHYPLIFDLSVAQIGEVITFLKSRPTAGRSNFRPPQVQRPATPVAPAQPATPVPLAGQEVTIGDLMDRGLTDDQIKLLLDLGIARPATPVAPAPQTANGGLAGEVAELKNGLLAVLELMAERESAEPTPGHSKVAAPTEPVTPAALPLEPGMLVTWQGKLYELTLQANGRIGSRVA